jgi:hypothetical protein
MIISLRFFISCCKLLTTGSSLSVKSISTQIYKNIEKNSVSSHCQTEKGKATNVPKPKDHNTKTLIIGSFINGI